jgi:hypothetical protein
MAALVRRVISLAVVVCCAGSPTALLACAADCVPGVAAHHSLMNPAGPQTSAPHHANHDARSAHQVPNPETHTGAVAPEPVGAFPPTAVPAATIGVDQCAHTSVRIETSTAASRADSSAAAGPYLAATSPIDTAPGSAAACARPTVVRAHPPLRLQAPLVLRI